MKWLEEWNQGITAIEGKAGIETKYVERAELGRNEVSQVVYVDFLPKVLADGLYKAALEPQVVGHVLESIQKPLRFRKRRLVRRKLSLP